MTEPEEREVYFEFVKIGKAVKITAIDSVTMRWNPADSCWRARRTSVTSIERGLRLSRPSSSLVRHLRDDADALHAGSLEPIDDVHLILNLKAPVHSEVYLLLS